MNTSKLLEAALELEAEAARCSTVAAELRAIVKRAQTGIPTPSAYRAPEAKGTFTPANVDAGGETTSQLVIAFNILKDARKPIHVNELVPMVADKRPGLETSRATVESALVRGMQGRFRGVIQRTAPGTFAVNQQ